MEIPRALEYEQDSVIPEVRVAAIFTPSESSYEIEPFQSSASPLVSDVLVPAIESIFLSADGVLENEVAGLVVGFSPGDLDDLVLVGGELDELLVGDLEDGLLLVADVAVEEDIVIVDEGALFVVEFNGAIGTGELVNSAAASD